MFSNSVFSSNVDSLVINDGSHPTQSVKGNSYNVESANRESTTLSKPKAINTQKTNSGRKRRKTPEEIAVLEAHFAKDPKWGRKTVQILKRTLNLTVDQIYKWGYDKKLQLAKKEVAKKKGAKSRVSNSIELDEVKSGEVHTPAITDYNHEVSELCDFSLKNIDDLSICGDVHETEKATENVDEEDCRSTHPACLTFSNSFENTKDTDFTRKSTIDDNQDFEDDDFFDMKTKGSPTGNPDIFEKSRSQTLRLKRNSFFRAPSGYCNYDFYTFQTGVFEKDEPQPFTMFKTMDHELR